MIVRILIVDAHRLARDSLRRSLEAHSGFTVVGEAVDGLEGAAKAEALWPNVVVMDLGMPESYGIEAARLICGRVPQTKVLMYSLYDSVGYCSQAINAGAVGFLLKESAGAEIGMAIHTVMDGYYFFGAGVTKPWENITLTRRKSAPALDQDE
jgi:DNA-binding NarL/FixJ family response regulator